MAEIRTIPEKILASGIKDTSIDDVSKFDKEVIHHNAGAPTAADDTGLGYAVGSIWVDSTNGDMYTAVSVTAEDANWKNMEGDEVNPPFTMQGSNNGWTAGGGVDPGPSPSIGSLNFITQWTFASDVGSGTDWGDLTHTVTKGNKGSARDDTRTLVLGGHSSHSPPTGAQDIMQTYLFASPGNATDVGEISYAMQDTASAPDGSYVLNTGGYSPSSPPADDSFETMDKIALTSPYAKTDIDEMSSGRYAHQGAGDTTYMYVSGGVGPGFIDTIERWQHSVETGSWGDVGELSQLQGYAGVVSGPTHVVTGGGAPGYWSNIMERYAYASSGNGADVGETAQIGVTAGSAGPSYGYFIGGNKPSPAPQSVDTCSRMAYSATSGGTTDCGEIGGANYPGKGFTGGFGSEN